jgi:hypothetical protein
VCCREATAIAEVEKCSTAVVVGRSMLHWPRSLHETDTKTLLPRVVA